ncbi:MAG: HAMP domain-containing protein [Myxococcales bacterium]|nr:HAMP domain-containing protein [Myxococcales bacterium]
MSVRTRLLLGFVSIVLVVTAATLVLLDRTIGRDLRDGTDDRLRRQALGVMKWLDTAGQPERLAPRLAGVVNARVTIVSGDGVVLGDSERAGDVGLAVGDAPEVRAARAGAVGRAVRTLPPDGGEAYLVAVRAPDGRVIRLSVPMTGLAATRRALRLQLALAALVGLAVALGLGVLAIRAIVRPLHAMTRDAARVARGDYAIGPPAPTKDELGVLSRALVGLAGEVQAQVGALTRERDRSLAVIGAMVEGVIVVEADGAVTLTNPAADRLVDPAAPLPDALIAPLSSARAGAPIEDEIELRGRTVRINVRPLPARRGAVCVLHDVSRLRALEVVRREFLANAAHELRTPITAIAGFAETLADDELEPAMRREFVATIARNADRIARLVAGLLELERQGTRPEAREPGRAIALAPMVAACVATAAAARPGAAAVAIDVAAELAVRGDHERLEQIVQNLIDNAHKHGAAPIAVTARADGGRVRLMVADGGAAIAPAQRERVFERFYRGAAARRGEGSGLGLAIARAAAEAMGGTLAVVDGPGGGTAFALELEQA